MTNEPKKKYPHTDIAPGKARELLVSHNQLIVLDVREEDEYRGREGHIPGAVNYPWTSGVLQKRYEELPRDREILVVCQGGVRSNMAAEFLESKGYIHVYDMQGGMSAWDGETAAAQPVA